MLVYPFSIFFERLEIIKNRNGVQNGYGQYVELVTTLMAAKYGDQSVNHYRYDLVLKRRQRSLSLSEYY